MTDYSEPLIKLQRDVKELDSALRHNAPRDELNALLMSIAVNHEYLILYVKGMGK